MKLKHSVAISLLVIITIAMFAEIPSQVVQAQTNTQSFQITSGIPGQAVKQVGEIYFTKDFEIDYASGPLILALTQDGTGNFGYDDGMRVVVTHADGKTASFEYNFSSGCTAVGSLAPIDISLIFATGRNKVHVEMFDICGFSEGGSPLWLVGNFTIPAVVTDWKQNAVDTTIGGGGWGGDGTKLTNFTPPKYLSDNPYNAKTNSDGCYTIHGYGCALVSVADVLNTYGFHTLPNGDTLDPGTLNDYAASKGWKNCFIDGLLAVVTGANGYNLGLNTHLGKSYTGTYKQRIEAALQDGNLPIVQIMAPSTSSHFVVIYGQTTNDYLIANPWYQSSFKGLLGSDYPGYSIKSVYIIDRGSRTAGTWVLEVHSPAQLLITDPNGQQTGYSVGTIVQNIPGTTYAIANGLSDDSGELPDQPDFPVFENNASIPGTYKVQVIGTGIGPYRLDLITAGIPSTPLVQSIKGTAQPGVIDTYLVTIGRSGTLTIQQQTSIDIKPGSNPAPINVGSQGVVPVAILSTPTFDARTVNFKTLTFGPKNTPMLDKQAAIQDVNGDGLPDLMAHFDNIKTGITKGATQACMAGKTLSGLAITGCDAITTVSLNP